LSWLPHGDEAGEEEWSRGGELSQPKALRSPSGETLPVLPRVVLRSVRTSESRQYLVPGASCRGQSAGKGVDEVTPRSLVGLRADGTRDVPSFELPEVVE
jgi:hypothetical protein